MRHLAMVLLFLVSLQLRGFSAEPSEAEKKEIQEAWSAISAAIGRKDREAVWGFFGGEAQEWVLGEEGRKAVRPWYEGPEAEFKALAKMMGLEVPKARELDLAQFVRRVVPSLLLSHIQQMSLSDIVGWQVAAGAVRVALKDKFGRRSRLVFGKGPSGWKLTRAFVEGLVEWWNCANRLRLLSVCVSLYEYRKKDNPEDLQSLVQPDMVKDESGLNCPCCAQAFEYWYPMEGVGTPPDRIMVFDAKPHRDGTRVVLTYMGADSWVDEVDFQEWLKRDVEFVRKGIDAEIAQAGKEPAQTARAKALVRLKEKIGAIK